MPSHSPVSPSAAARLCDAFHEFRQVFACPLCHRLLREPYTIQECGHCFCRDCIVVRLGMECKCPLCNLPAIVKNCARNPSWNTMSNCVRELEGILEPLVQEPQAAINGSAAAPVDLRRNVAPPKAGRESSANQATPVVPSSQTSTHRTASGDLDVLPGAPPLEPTRIRPTRSVSIPDSNSNATSLSTHSSEVIVELASGKENNVPPPSTTNQPTKPGSDSLVPAKGKGKRRKSEPRSNPPQRTVSTVSSTSTHLSERKSSRRSSHEAASNLKALYDSTEEPLFLDTKTVAPPSESRRVSFHVPAPSSSAPENQVSGTKDQRAVKEWQCELCTFLNLSWLKRCKMCGSHRDDSTNILHHQPTSRKNVPRVCCLLSGMTESIAALMEDTVETLYGLLDIVEFSLADEFTSSVTHLVTVSDEHRICQRTIKYLLAVASEVPIVDYKWLVEMAKKKRKVPEDSYKILGDSAMGLTKVQDLYGRSEKLFHGRSFCILPGFHPELRNPMLTLLGLCGVTVLKRRPAWKDLRPATMPAPSLQPTADTPIVIVPEPVEASLFSHLQQILSYNHDPLFEKLHV